MNLTQLRAFHAVARHQSFTAAARALHVSQPAVTIQVRGLEQDHDVELLVRRPRSVDLTPAGRALFAVAEQLFACEERAARLLGEAGALRAGALRIGADNPHLLMPLLVDLRRRLPEIELEASFGNSRAIAEQLARFDVDVALVTSPPTGP